MIYPRAFSHVGLSVPNLEKAISFYHEVFGWYIIMEPAYVYPDDSDIGIMCDDVFGKGWDKFRIAHMSTADGIGIELFEFPDSYLPDNNLDFNRTGVFHFGIQDPDIEGLVEKIVSHGGKQRMPIRYYYKDTKPYRMVYVEDPFGITFEIYSHSYELTYSAGAY